MTPKSPFYIVENFISPMMCEDMVDDLNFLVPDKDKDGKDIKTTKTCGHIESILYERLMLLIPKLQSYYNVVYKGTEEITFEMFPQGSKGDATAENSNIIRGKWMKTKQRDLTAVLFLCDYQDQPPIDGEFEVYGSKLEFPQHSFGFNPSRGMLIIFPSDPHFINGTSTVYV